MAAGGHCCSLTGRDVSSDPANGTTASRPKYRISFAAGSLDEPTEHESIPRLIRLTAVASAALLTASPPQERRGSHRRPAFAPGCSQGARAVSTVYADIKEAKGTGMSLDNRGELENKFSTNITKANDALKALGIYKYLIAEVSEKDKEAHRGKIGDSKRKHHLPCLFLPPRLHQARCRPRCRRNHQPRLPSRGSLCPASSTARWLSSAQVLPQSRQ